MRSRLTELRPQIVTLKKRGGRCYLPCVFTEYGATMFATVLNSDVAVRQMVSGNAALAAKFAELKWRPDSHDEAIANLFEAIRQLLTPPEKPKREIGFHVCEGNGQYRVRHRRQTHNPQSTVSNP